MRHRILQLSMTAIMIMAVCSITGCGTDKIVGEWTFSGFATDQEELSIEELADAIGSKAADQVAVFLVVNDDGTFLLTDTPKELEGQTGTYEKTGASKYTFIVNGNAETRAEIKDGRLFLTETDDEGSSTQMIFEK